MIWVRWFYSLFERMRLKRKRTMFIHADQPLITLFYIKRCLFFVELAMSQRWSALFCATGAWGGKPIGRVRVNQYKVFIFVSSPKWNSDSIWIFWTQKLIGWKWRFVHRNRILPKGKVVSIRLVNSHSHTLK